MKAIVLKQTGEPTELEKNLLIEERLEPQFSDDEALIKIKYAALNHRDLWITKGLYSGIKFPIVPGSDCSGIVYKTGINVKEFKEGDEVIVYPVTQWGESELYQSKNFRILGLPDDGTLREYISVHKSNIFKKPENLTMQDAAAIPLAGLTAYRASFVRNDIMENDNLFITGIGGGVSTFALTFGINIGANVYVTSGSDLKIEKAVKYGAKGGVNYKNENWDSEIIKMSENSINNIIDGTGGETFNKCLNILNPGGTIINYGATTGAVKQLELRRIFWKQLNVIGTTMGTMKDFREMINFIEEKKIKPVIDKVYDMNEAYKAFQRMSNSEQFGKILIAM
jgi:NADPH:quinone reductase-like Zn-dependent oxidoreductase